LECFLLGTGGMMPMPYRLLTSLAVRLNGRVYLFDAGEGTQLGWKKVHIGVRGLDLLAVTHLHADHVLGIPGLLMLKAQMENPSPLTIIGPPGIGSFIQQSRNILEFYLNYPIEIIEWSEDQSDLAYVDDQVRIFWQPLQHTRFCLGYRLEEHERPGKFNPEAARRLGAPEGPSWGKLQKGETIITASGKTVTPGQVLGPPRRGRHVAFIVDTRPAKTIYRLCKDVDIAFIEGMFLPEDAEHADAKGHMTVVESSRIAKRAGARRAVLVHISPRYANGDLHRLETAALEQYDNVCVGRDLEVYPVSYVE
jgi:ribonuclease Z